MLKSYEMHRILLYRAPALLPLVLPLVAGLCVVAGVGGGRTVVVGIVVVVVAAFAVVILL